MNTEIAPQIAERLGDALKTVEKGLDQMGPAIIAAVRCCPACENFDAQLELCKLVKPYPARPPATIIAFGCDSFDMGTPF